VPIILVTQEAEIRRIEFQGQPRQIVAKTLSRRYPIQKRAGRVAQVVEHLPSLPSKCEALSSKPKCHQKKKTETIKEDVKLYFFLHFFK
jgi:hypothetical protein